MNEFILNELKDLTGYIGSAITDVNGKILAFDMKKNNILKNDKGYSTVLSTLNKSFKDNHNVTTSLELGGTKEMMISTENAIIIMTCTGAASKNHLHIFVLLEKGGNEAFARMILARVVERIK